MTNRMQFIGKILLFFLLLLLCACSSLMTTTSQYNGTDVLLEQQDYLTAIQRIEKAKGKQYRKKDRVLYYLDLGMLYHYAGDYRKSNEMLTQAENNMEELYTKSISKAAMSMLLNDNVLEYSGEDYEDIYTNVFKALNYLALSQSDEAFVEIRRINMKLDLLEDKYGRLASEMNKSSYNKIKLKTGENRFLNDALGRYLSMLLYRKEGKLDDARIDREKIMEAFDLQKNIYDFPIPNLPDSLDSEGGKVKVNILSFTGRSPVKKSYDMFLTTGEDMVLISGNKPDFFVAPVIMPVEEGYHFRFSVPYIQAVPSRISAVKVVVDDGIPFELETIEDINRVATEAFKVKEPLIYMKSLTRTIVKGIVSERQKRKMRDKNTGWGGILLSLATDIAVDLTENADLRLSRFFPSRASMGEISLDPGNHFFKMNYYDSNGQILYVENLGIYEVKAGQLNLLESHYLR